MAMSSTKDELYYHFIDEILRKVQNSNAKK